MPTHYTLEDWRDRYMLASASCNMLDAADALTRILTHLDASPEGTDAGTRRRIEQTRDMLAETARSMHASTPSDERGNR